MEAYPTEYVEHNLPLVILSGVEIDDSSVKESAQQQSGTRIQAASPLCNSERAQTLAKQFLLADGTDQPWNAGALPGPTGRIKYKMKAIGRTYTLPLRKAAPLATSIDGSRSNPNSPSIGTELHSPLSPLSPGSPLYPDGVFTPLWLAKHQEQVPVVFVAFFDILAASTVNNDQDAQLKSDVNSIRAAINKSGFKTKLAVVLISDRSILQAPELEDRLLSIRRATSLDSKSGLFFVPPMSTIELSTFVQSMLTTMQPLCIDYYRDLTKHARRKKARTSPPPLGSAVGGSVLPLSVSGWNVRYEVKQGAFAEFRQEMDTADRHYAAALDELFNTEGVLETCPTSSPRWAEARVLSDILALRILRCQLWSSSTTGAAQSWVNYRIRIAELLIHRGIGLESHEWQAWKAKWAETMAQLINRAELPAFQQIEKKQDESIEMVTAGIYAIPEKPSAAIDRMPPVNHLHHSGYWLKLAAQEWRSRRGNARKASKTDHIPSQQSSSTSQSAGTNTGDPLQHPPSELYDEDMFNTARVSEAAVEAFNNKIQMRMTELIKLDLAHDYFDVKRYNEAIEILTALWQETTWRNDGWLDLFADLLLLLHQCAVQLSRADLVLGATYELLSVPTANGDVSPLNLKGCLNGLETTPSKLVSLNIKDQQRLCPIAASFAFETKETHVGESLGCQLSLESRVNGDAAALILSSVRLHFGPSKVVTIMHEVGDGAIADQITGLSDIVENDDGSLDTKADLTLRSNDRHTYNFTLRFRTPQTARLSQLVLEIKTESFEIEHTFSEASSHASDTILVHSANTFERKLLHSADSTAVVVLPKPPKVQISLHGMQKEYYTDEAINIDVEIINAESEPVSGKVSAQINGERDTSPAMQWKESDQVEPTAPESQHTLDTPIWKAIPRLDKGTSLTNTIQIVAPPEPLKTSIEICVDYTLSTDKAASLRKNLTLDLTFVAPFKAEFNFGPLLYADPWPSYFDPNGGSTADQPGGIPQLWCLSSQVRSLAKESILLKKVEVAVEGVSGESLATTRNRDVEDEAIMKTGDLSRHSFEMRTQKYTLDDRRPTTIESRLRIAWARSHNSADSITTSIPVPRLTLPVSEPRVLCTIVASDSTPDEYDAVFQYHIENPSTHFLTFALTMEASEDFAFSGPKLRTLSLAPMSRHKVEYCIVLHDDEGVRGEGGKWVWPLLQVVDSFYQKTLRVHPAGDDVRVDEKGNIGVWIEIG